MRGLREKFDRHVTHRDGIAMTDIDVGDAFGASSMGEIEYEYHIEGERRWSLLPLWSRFRVLCGVGVGYIGAFIERLGQRVRARSVRVAGGTGRLWLYIRRHDRLRELPDDFLDA